MSRQSSYRNWRWYWYCIDKGAALGAVFGLFMSSTETSMDERFLKMSAKEQTKITLRQIGSKALSTSKAFATFSGVFVSAECITEAIRGKDDHYNSVIAGCSTGAILAHKGIQILKRWNTGHGIWLRWNDFIPGCN
jgi:hypothetical protein